MFDGQVQEIGRELLQRQIKVSSINFNKLSIKKTKPENLRDRSMPINSISLNLSPTKITQTIILPSSKFNKFIKLIQEEKHEIRSSLKPQAKGTRDIFNLNEGWKERLEKNMKVLGYSGRPKCKRIKTEHLENSKQLLNEQKWAIIKRKVERNQMNIKFPQLPLVNQSLKISQTPTYYKNESNKQLSENSNHRKLRFSDKPVWEVKRKRTIETEDCFIDNNLEISAWTMNDF